MSTVVGVLSQSLNVWKSFFLLPLSSIYYFFFHEMWNIYVAIDSLSYNVLGCGLHLGFDVMVQWDASLAKDQGCCSFGVLIYIIQPVRHNFALHWHDWKKKVAWFQITAISRSFALVGLMPLFNIPPIFSPKFGLFLTLSAKLVAVT